MSMHSLHYYIVCVNYINCVLGLVIHTIEQCYVIRCSTHQFPFKPTSRTRVEFIEAFIVIEFPKRAKSKSS